MSRGAGKLALTGLLFAGTVLVSVNGTQAAVWHVRQDGSGNFTTIQACVNAMSAGDTCLVGDGTYQERVTFPSSKSGRAGALTIIEAETNLTVTNWGFDTSGVSYVHIQGFSITLPASLTGWNNGIGIMINGNNIEVVSNYLFNTLYPAIDGGGANAHVAGNHIYMCGSGIYIGGTSWLVEGNDIERLQYHTEIGDADFTRFFGSYHVIRSNFFHGTIQSEIGPAHVDGFQTYDDNGQTVQHIRIDGNRMQDFYHEGAMLEAIYHSNSFDLVFCNNTFAGPNSAIGIIASTNLQQVQIYNNDFVNIQCGPYFVPPSSGAVYNNIFYGVNCFLIQSTQVTGGNNLIYYPGESLSPQFSSDIVNQDPEFVSVANYNFHLLPTSPAIDKGAALSIVTNDMDGVPRPQGLAWDIGASEFNLGQTVTAPQITSQPQNNTSAPGTLASFSATANGTMPLGYQWLHWGVPITNGLGFSGAILSTLTILPVQPADAGPYALVVTNIAGAVTSAVVTLTVTGPPVITAQPTGTNVVAGSSVSFGVTAAGSPTLNYQWRFNGTNLSNGGQFSGATSATLTLSAANTGNAGGYSVVVMNSSGSATSTVASLSVTPAPPCVTPPMGMISWWPGDGNSRDIWITNNGSLEGGATASASGLVGQAFSFDGTNGFVQIPDASTLHPTNLTIEAWVRFSSLDSAGSGASPGGDQYIVFKQNSQSSNFEGFDLSKTRGANGDVFRFLVSSAAGQSVNVISTTTISTGVWYHVAGVRGPTATQLYVNGQLQGQAAIGFAQDYGTLPLFFGTSGESYWDHKLAGTLDEVSLYNRALSSNEIAAIYAIGAGGKCKGASGPLLTQFAKNGGNVSFTLIGQPGHTYNINASSDLKNWSTVTTVTLSNSTMVITQTMSGARKFYRAVMTQ
ncbi:MAG TPA: LamG-like jellyroll fold domain-containing protein [Verrucomicrobiae bacterium]|nr:LamG-like jellyroll fold domain-containing protein [Verrucomicrobiae bacterium]